MAQSIIRTLYLRIRRTLNSILFDCDGSGNGKQGYLCWLSREIYRTLWDWKDKDIVKGKNLMVQASTVITEVIIKDFQTKKSKIFIKFENDI